MNPANTILYNSLEDQVADHLNNGVMRNLETELADKWDEQVFRIGETIPMKKPAHRRSTRQAVQG